jgi:hypothetical protein
MANVIEVFARNGCNAFMSGPEEFVRESLQEVEQRTGVPMIWVCTPSEAEPDNPEVWKRSVDQTKKVGGTFCFPHQLITDPLLDHHNHRLAPQLIEYLRCVREMELIPGLSTHTPEAVVCADACEADVESYIQPYNALGFLCQVETDWVQRIIHDALKPVMVIKPLAAGRLMPQTGMPFVWNSIRDCDMVAVGTMSTYEAEEIIEISRACLENREPEVELQYTRSKGNLAPSP